MTDDQLVMSLVWKIAEAKGLIKTAYDPLTRTIEADRNYIVKLIEQCQNAVNIPIP